MTTGELFGTALVADIGPQACRFALLSEIEGDRPLFSHTAELAVSQHQGVVEAFAAYLASLGRPAPATLALAVAAPVNTERFIITQSGWSFSVDDLRAAFGFETVVAINEAAATALSLEWLDVGDTLSIGGASSAPSPLLPGRYAIVSPDFGLGVSAVEVSEGGCQVIDTEGGHMAFAPNNALEIELLQRLTPIWGRVSYERVISWPGLAEIYSVMAARERGRAEAWSPLEIMLQARAGADPLCQKAVHCFLDILGDFAGDVALAVGANRGVFLAGRFVQEAAELIGASTFRARFESKGRLSAVVGALPTWAVVARSSVLNGVARQLVMKLEAERGTPSPVPTPLAQARDSTPQGRDGTDLVATLMDGAGCGLLVLDANLRIVLTNERYWEGSSVRRALRAPGQPIAPCLEALSEGHDWGSRDAASVLEKLTAGQPFTAERTALGGRVLRDEARPVPFGGWVFTALDITLSRRRAVELEALTVDLRAAKRRADDASHAKTAFLATMSHEIRTPLNGVLGMAQAMAQDALSPVQGERLEVIRQSGEALLAILNDVLDLSKIESGKLDLEQVEFDIGQLLQGANSSFTGLAHGKGLSFSLRIEPRARGRYLGDPTRIRQIAYNLISNALKFTASGEVRVVADRVEDALRITVSDTGIGIPADRLDALFEKFVQADVSTTRSFGGTGLGLAICRELTQMMGGAIGVRSDVGQGTCFQVDLPLPRLGGEARAATKGADPRPVSAAMTVKILAAEDNTVNQLVLKTILGQIGADLTVVDDGQQAVDAWARERWDVILMDVQMPVMDGPTAARRIRQMEGETGRERTPIVALTANVMTHQTTTYLAAGMDGCVAKPIQIDALLAALAEACQSSAEQLQG